MRTAFYEYKYNSLNKRQKWLFNKRKQEEEAKRDWLIKELFKEPENT